MSITEKNEFFMPHLHLIYLPIIMIACIQRYEQNHDIL
jgi:hypothetical protein